MARNFSVNGAGTAAAAPITIIQVLGANLAYTRIFDVTVGGPATAPNDYAATYTVARNTTACTVTSFTPLATDPTAGASLAVGGASATGITSTVEGTFAAANVLLQIPLNMRATFRYVASPGAEFINSFTAANGVCLRQAAASTAFVPTGTVIWFE